MQLAPPSVFQYQVGKRFVLVQTTEEMIKMGLMLLIIAFTITVALVISEWLDEEPKAWRLVVGILILGFLPILVTLT